ncbi:PREDICTED: alpha-tocopherol transfer protein-like [Cyphomyrmex costatus]|uniref:alpha-tocopherol transfer protein-like n=1 Tax=Cyphomyrmex costatus TaxID=456900 RepID=UPI0008524534|nr:PREDICTED: alpha-tocopherol transfer protein-like [Cyphomyrmex costatus]
MTEVKDVNLKTLQNERLWRSQKKTSNCFPKSAVFGFLAFLILGSESATPTIPIDTEFHTNSSKFFSMSIIKGITLEEEMKRNPQMKLSDIESLREWCEKQQHLPKIEDSFLALFLHNNYYQIEPTKNKIENYYTIRTLLQEEFCNRDPLKEKGLQQIFKTVAIFPLNGLTKDGYKMAFSSLLDSDPSSYDWLYGFKYVTMSMDVHFLMDGTNNDFVFIIDGSKFSVGHVTRMNPLVIKKYAYYVQEAAPIRFKAVHIINTSPAMELFMSLIKPFIKKEFIDTIHFHSSLESLSKYISVDALPNEIGGKAGSVHKLAEIEMKRIQDYREWFLLDESARRVNEALRVGKSKTTNDLFGTDGNFKKLDID